MLVQLLTNPGAKDFPELAGKKAGDSADVRRDIGAQMIARGQAIDLSPRPSAPPATTIRPERDLGPVRPAYEALVKKLAAANGDAQTFVDREIAAVCDPVGLKKADLLDDVRNYK